MTNHDNTAPATKTYCVWADSNVLVYQHVQALTPQEAFRLAQDDRDGWDACFDAGDNEYTVSPDVMDVQTEEFTRVADPPAATMRQASQRLYDALQAYLIDIPDSELPEDLVTAMDEMEAAWLKADGTVPEQGDGNVA